MSNRQNAADVPKIVETKLGRVEYASYGEGPVIIALHGGMGGYDQSLLLARSAIANPGYRILALSRPGYLGTPLRSGHAPEEQADLYAALLDAFGLTRAAVIAVSAGGPSALQFALRHSARCWGLVTVSACTGHLDTRAVYSRRLAMMALTARIPFMSEIMRRQVAANPKAMARRSVADAGLCARTLAHPEAAALMTALMLSTFERLGERIPGTVNDTAQFRLIQAYPLERITAPTLAIHGTADPVVPFSHGEAVAKRVPGAEFLAAEGGEHVALFTHLDDVRARVAAFLTRHAPSE